MKKIGKKNTDKFLRLLDRILLDANFKRTITSDKFNSMYEWVKDTENFGKIYFDPDNDSDSRIFSIFGRFEDVDKCKNINQHNINPYSGKCNFHSTDMESIIKGFENFLLIIN